MEKFYLLGILVFCFVIIRTLFSCFFKTHKRVREIIEPNFFNKEVKFSDEQINDTDFTNWESKVSDGKDVDSFRLSKNKWLYPNDDLGNLVKGKVYDSKTYDSEINDKSSKNKMKILTIKKKKNNPK